MNQLIAIIVFLIFSFSLQAQIDPQKENKIDSIMLSNYPLTEPGAVLLISQNGKTIFHKGYGLANVELTVLNKPEFVFAIGSTSKQFTAACLLHLQDDGKISLDDDIKKYLPDYNTHDELITIRHLLTHTSGIPSFTELDTFFSLINTDISTNDITMLFMDKPLLFKPGTNWSYSNSGYTLAGMIVEKVSGSSLESYLRQQIFLPLGMNSTSLGSNSRIIPRMVTGYDIGEFGYSPTREYSWTWPFGAGGIVSNTSDMLLWDESFYGEKLLSKKAIKELFTPYILANGISTNYGLGWGVGQYNNIQFIRHGGAIGGFLSEAVRIPSEHLYVIILSNNTAKSPSGSIDKIINQLMDLEIEQVSAYEETSDLPEYTGVYLIERTGGRLVSNYAMDSMYRYITMDSTGLFTQTTGGARSKLDRIGKDEFHAGDTYTRYIFDRNIDKEITGIKLINIPTGYGPIDFSPKTNLALPADKKNITVDAEILQRYVGKYDLGGGFYINVSTNNTQLFIQATGQSKFEVYAESETIFYLTIVDASIEFVLDENGTVISMILHQGGDYPGIKIE